ncbi:MAG: class I SAM-dependent methyltransferase [Thermaerobacterales bacterium]
MSESDVEAVDPFDPDYPNFWIKLEHLGRYQLAVDLLQKHIAGGKVSQDSKPERSVWPEPAPLALDVACGTGYGALELAAAGFRVAGVDRAAVISRLQSSLPEGNPAWLAVDLDCLAELGGRVGCDDYSRPTLHLVLASNELSPVRAVCCFETLEHVVDPAGLLRQLRACLEPGGQLLLSVPMAHQEPKHKDGSARNPYHRHLFTRSAVEDMLQGAGFLITEVFGQALCNRLLRRESRLLAGRRDGPAIRWHPTDPAAVRHLARLIGYPEAAGLDHSYSLLWRAEAEERKSFQRK